MNQIYSINIAEDLRRPEALEDFCATQKSIRVIEAICNSGSSRATRIIAPYGAGKSMAALAGITILQGDSAHAEELIHKIAKADEKLARALKSSAGSAFALLLHGKCLNLAQTLCQQANIDPPTSVRKALSSLVGKLRQDGVEHLAIVWDEFGQHLESTAREGKEEDLLAVQDLAEWTVRRKRPTVTLTTLMHMGFDRYASRVLDDARWSWSKIEGRFDSLRLVDDWADDYELIARKVDNNRGHIGRTIAADALSLGFFPDFSDAKALEHLLVRTKPLTPAALDLLPRLAAQIAQYQRTVSRFLDETVAISPECTIGLDKLYDFLVPAMRRDTGIGGTFRRYVEAETALSRSDTALQEHIVKATALLQLGNVGERRRLQRNRLAFAVAAGTSIPVDETDAEIDRLVERKILLHRSRVDDMSLWHGPDLDLQGLIAEEVKQFSGSQDVVSTLERLFPPVAYTAPRYNHQHLITRFAPGRFELSQNLMSANGLTKLAQTADREDALVALVVDASIENSDLLDAISSLPEHAIVALPRRATEVKDSLAELVAIRSLLGRSDIVDTDPLVVRELGELQVEAELLLHRTLDDLMNTDHGEVIWVSAGHRYDFASGQDSGDVLTRIFERRFPDTPVIGNEQVVRRKLTATARSARKRCMLAIIERSGSASLGYAGATSADSSIFRTVFERSGLYTDVPPPPQEWASGYIRTRFQIPAPARPGSTLNDSFLHRVNHVHALINLSTGLPRHH